MHLPAHKTELRAQVGPAVRADFRVAFLTFDNHYFTSASVAKDQIGCTHSGSRAG